MEDRQRDVQDAFMEEVAFITKRERQISNIILLKEGNKVEQNNMSKREQTNMEHEFFNLTTLQDI